MQNTTIIDDPLDLVMTVAQVVAEYRINPRTVQLAVNADPMLGRKVGGTLLLRREKVERVFRHLRKATPRD